MEIGLDPRARSATNVTSIESRRAARPMHVAVQRAIGTMRQRYQEPITLTDIAAEVFVSPFHFSRLFAKVTGVTPGRYLTAIRLFEAKRLLLTSSLTVADIVCSVGYSSVGTFTTRFTRAVGMTPSQYRDPQVQELLLAISPHFQRLPSLATLHAAGLSCGSLHGGPGTVTARVELPRDAPPATVLVGVFSEPIPQRGPTAFTSLTCARSAVINLDNVPRGRWTVLAVAEHTGSDGRSMLSLGMLRNPISITGSEAVPIALRLRPLQSIDPPIAITFAPEARRPTSPALARALSAPTRLGVAA